MLDQMRALWLIVMNVCKKGSLEYVQFIGHHPIDAAIAHSMHMTSMEGAV